MLTEKEREGCREILKKLDVVDLIALTDTVSNRSVSVENRKEALDAIMLYSPNALQLLRRKKVKREHLYTYLAENKYIAPPSTDKPALIRKILDLWGSSNDAPVDNDNSNEEDGLANSDRAETGRVAPKATAGVHTSAASTSLDCQALAQQFVKWYYKVLNSLNLSPSGSSSEWGPQHFWVDSKLSLLMISGQTSHDDCQGSLAVSEKLHELVRTEKLHFNPFVDGVTAQMNAYGLVRVAIGGTVHRFSQCIGIFEQSFGLIKDPSMDNNWKIKFTELKMKAGENQVKGQSVPAIGS